MRKNIVESGKPEMLIWLMRNLHRIPKATSTCSQCAVLITFALQQSLHERALVKN
jgi:hypothetical protein